MNRDEMSWEEIDPDPSAIESPCVSVCVLDPVSGYCEGCLRTLAEVARWSSYSPAERRRVIAELEHRVIA